MKRRAFTLSEAVNFCRKYTHLITEIGKNLERDVIECITVSPFDRLNKFLFLDFYGQTKCPQKALEFYKDFAFDVIIIFKSPENVFCFKDVYSFLASHGIVLDGNVSATEK